MHKIYVKDIVRLGLGEVLCGDSELELSNFCTDTRKIGVGDVYVGLVGDKFDGNDFDEDAIEKGASCLILSKRPSNLVGDLVTVVLVKDTLICLQELARYKRGLYDIPVIGITGSSGKTSTKDIVASVVSKKYKVHKTEGNLNNHIGVPLTILSMEEDDEVLVVEMGMNHFGEISNLSKIAKPSICLITNVGTSHIDNLGSRDGILKAKLEIFDGMIGELVVVNGDDDKLRGEVSRLSREYLVETVSFNLESTYRAVNVDDRVFASKYDIEGNIFGIEVNVGGKAYIYNSLMGYAVGKYLGISDEDIKDGIATFRLSQHRLERKVTSNGIVLIDDTYNANYDSVSASVGVLSKVKDKRKVLILGDMLGLGEHSKVLHYNLGDVIVNNQIDILITVGEFTKETIKRCIELGMNKNNIYSFLRESDTYSFLEEFLKVDDIALVKGSHGMNMVFIVDYLMSK